MAEFKAISQSEDAKAGWIQPTDISFAKYQSYAKINIAEIPQAMQNFPLVFAKDDEDNFSFVALFSLTHGENLFVNENNKWSGGYIPNGMRHYPFVLVKKDKDMVLAFDMSSGLYMGADVEFQGQESFFDEDSKPSELFQRKLDFFQRYAKNSTITQKAVQSIVKCNILVPIDSEYGEKIYKVDEKALHALDAESLKELQNSNALRVVYGHIFSLGRLQLLKKLTEDKLQQQNLSEDMNLDEFFNNDNNISFGF